MSSVGRIGGKSEAGSRLPEWLVASGLTRVVSRVKARPLSGRAFSVLPGLREYGPRVGWGTR